MIQKRKRFPISMDEAYGRGLVMVGEVTPGTEYQSAEDRNRGREPRPLVDEQTGNRIWKVMVTDPEETRAKRASFEVFVTADVQPVPPTTEVAPGMRPIALEGLQVEPYVTGQGEFKSLAYRVWATGFADPAQGSGHTSKTPSSTSTTSKDTSTKEAA